MRRTIASLTLLPFLLLPACSSTRIESGVVINPRTTGRLDTIGDNPEISIRNASNAPLPIEIGWGQAGRERDTLAPATTRWWNPQGPRSFWFINDTDRAIALTYLIKDADVTFTMPAK